MKNNTQEDLAEGFAKDRGERIKHGNHFTGYFALMKLWKYNPEARDALKIMDYGFRTFGTARLQSERLACQGGRKDTEQYAVVQT